MYKTYNPNYAEIRRQRRNQYMHRKPQGTGLGTALSKYSLPTMNIINTQNQISFGGNTSKNISSLDHMQNTANTQALPSIQRKKPRYTRVTFKNSEAYSISSESDEIERDSSGDEGVVIFAEKDSEQERERKRKIKKKYRKDYKMRTKDIIAIPNLPIDPLNPGIDVMDLSNPYMNPYFYKNTALSPGRFGYAVAPITALNDIATLYK